MTAGERLQEVIRHRGLNIKTFSELCGYDRPQVLYDLIKGKTRNISATMCAKILEHNPDINKVWLLTGEGAMLVSDINESADIDEPKTVPLVPISAIAGPISAYYESGVDFMHCRRIISPVPNADFALPVTGDSMEPIFPDGSTIFVKRINEASFIPWGHPMVIDTENGVFIKNVMPDDLNEAYIWAVSVNPKYPRMHVPKVAIAGMYRVLNVSKSFETM